MTDAMLGAGLERVRDGPFKTQKDQSLNEKVPSQRLRGTFKNCRRLILAESVSPENLVTMRPFREPSIPTGHPTGQQRTVGERSRRAAEVSNQQSRLTAPETVGKPAWTTNQRKTARSHHYRRLGRLYSENRFLKILNRNSRLA